MARNTIDTTNHRLRFSFDDPRPADSQAIDLEGLPGLGDSGGPALLATELGWQVAGIAIGELQREGELLHRQGMYGAVGVYERLSLHADWIEEIIRADLGVYPGQGLSR